MNQKKLVCAGAGVLVCSYDENQKVYKFLLGKERFLKPGERHNAWGLFGGGIKRKDPLYTATTEFFEETMGSIYPTPDHLHGQLLQDDFLLCYDTETVPGRYFRTYVIEIEYSEEVVHEFSRRYNLALSQPSQFVSICPLAGRRDNARRVKCDFLEKVEIGWFLASHFDPTARQFIPMRIHFRTELEALRQFLPALFRGHKRIVRS